MERRVVVTGIGILSPIGIGKEAFWHALIAHERGIRRINPFLAFTGATRSIASSISTTLGIAGPALTISMGCTGGIDAVGHAFNELRRHAIDLAVVGAAEAPICPIVLS